MRKRTWKYLLTCSHSQLVSSGAMEWEPGSLIPEFVLLTLHYVASPSVIQPTMQSAYHELILC